MRHNEAPELLEGVLDANGVLLHPYCYVCNLSVMQDGAGFCQMFTEDVEDVISPAKILSEILAIEINPELSHSQIVCVNCNMLCLEYQQLIQRAETIRLDMASAYNRTVIKLTGLTEKDLKEQTEVATVDSEEHIDSALQNFNKELMLMEDVFQMEGLEAGAIEGEDTMRPTVYMDGVLPKMDFVWQNAPAPAGETQSKIDPNDLLQADRVNEICEPVPQASEPLPDTGEPLPDSESPPPEEATNLQDQEDCTTTVSFQSTGRGQLLVAECSSSQELGAGSKLDQIISETNHARTEVREEDGTVYCIYEDVIESYSDEEEEEQPEMEMHGDGAEASAEDVIEYDEIVVESSAVKQEESVFEQIQEMGTSQEEDEVEETSASATEDVPGKADNVAQPGSLQPLFIKVESMYYCTLCSTNGKLAPYNVKTIALHLKNEHGKKILVCERCDAVFYRRPTYYEHMDQHTAEDCSDFCCDVCGIKFLNVRTLRVHRKTHAAINKIWPCDVCEKKFASKSMYEVHMNTHKGLRPYKCTVCSRDFTSKYILTVHMKTHRERPRAFACNKCGKSFYTRSNLMHHEKTHFGKPDFQCTECGKSFISQHNLNVHKVIHLAVKPFVCRTCGKAFARKSEVADHERIHTGEKPFSCDMCDASFAQRSNLYSHKRLTHLNDKRFECEICSARFKRRRLLLYHTRAAHTGERPYKCEVCPATFVYPEHFQKHKRIHNGTKPFACEVCHKTFNSRDNRNAHRYVHSDKKQFECVTCGSGFMRKSQLYAHMQKRGHLNDTIVVNQPRISANDVIELDTDSTTAAVEAAAPTITYEPITEDHTGAIYEEGEEEWEYDDEEEGHGNDIIEADDEYYLQSVDQEEAGGTEPLLDEVGNSNGAMGLSAKIIEINDTDWSNLIEQED